MKAKFITIENKGSEGNTSTNIFFMHVSFFKDLTNLNIL